MIREAAAADWPNIWPIFREIAKAGDTYAYPTDINTAEAEHLWITLPVRTYVLEREGQIVGTYYIKENQSGPGNHVCNCGYMVASHARGSGVARSMCEHSQVVAVKLGFLAMQFNFVASSNEAAVALWQTLGFDIAGTLPAAFNHPERGYVDAYVMYKSLAGWQVD